MKRPSTPPAGPMKIIVVAVAFMLLADHFIFGGKRSYIEEAKKAGHEVAVEPPQPAPAPVYVRPEDGKEFFEAPLPQIMEEPDIVKAPDTPVPKKPVVAHDHPRIAIIIDDLGMDIKHTKQVLDLPAPVTLAFLPYGTKTRELAAAGKKKGHHLIIHTPMEAMDGKLNIGPGGLHEGMSADEITAAFGKMLESFEGYEGINNHMGSRLTQDKAAMDVVMGILKDKKLFFVDSKTIQSSVAAEEAAAAGIPYASRDVFLDHVESREFVDGALKKTEELALRRGYAIAIGHPKEVTIEALKAWLPTLKAKGIELVPVGDLLN